MDLKFSTHINDHHTSDRHEGQGHIMSKAKVIKVKNGKIQFSDYYQKRWSKVKVARVKVKSRRSRSQGEGQSCLGEFSIPLTRGRCETQAFSFH